MICELCGASEDLGKSHIIPESFFVEAGSKNETLILATNKENEFPKKRPIGEYDSEILCKSCEKIFGDWDNHGKNLLIDEYKASNSIVENGQIIGHEISHFQYPKLKLFLLSMVWRAGASKRPFFDKVKLGPHQDRLREMIVANNPGSKDKYSAQVFSFRGMPNGYPILMPIRLMSTYGINYYRFYLGELFVDIKIDSRKTPSGFGIGEIKDGHPLFIASRNIREMSEYKIFKKIANSPNNDKVT